MTSQSRPQSPVSREARLNTMSYPQEHIVVASPKPRHPQSPPSSPLLAPALSRPLSPVLSEVLFGRNQPTAAELATYGIRVRDFAYESTLPPIAPVRLLPRQVQPGPKPLKRTRRDYDADEDVPYMPRGHNYAGPSSVEGEAKRAKLVRTPTEPAASSAPMRTRGFADLAAFASVASQFLFGSQPTEDSAAPSFSQQFSPTEKPYTRTPLVTPNGSIHWQANSPTVPQADMSEYATESPSIIQKDTVPQTRTREPILYSQTALEDTPMETDDEPSGIVTPTLSSPLSSPPASLLLIPGPPLGTRASSISSHPPHQLAQSGSSTAPVDMGPPSPPFRYHLRKRPVPVIASPRTPIAKRPPRNSQPHSSTRTFSVRSSHARSKSHTEKEPPRPRGLRKNTDSRGDSMVVS